MQSEVDLSRSFDEAEVGLQDRVVDLFEVWAPRQGLFVVEFRQNSLEASSESHDFLLPLGDELELDVVVLEHAHGARNTSRQTALDAGASGVIGGELFSDAMGAPGSYEGTYLGMIDHNATTIARALGGDVPKRGMSGRLKVEA